MENKIELKPVSGLLGMNFFIPSYQRGYRWDEQQVTDLLGDIYDYTGKSNDRDYAGKSGKSAKEFYCLQPIVVTKCDAATIEQQNLLSDQDNNIWYEVIDGQQRLTTIRILFSYLINKHLHGASLEEEYGKKLFKLEYETRGVSAQFLDNILPSKETMDAYFISEAYTHIEKWFRKKTPHRDARERILRTLVSDMNNKSPEGVVQVIWYEINTGEKQESYSDTKPIDTFMRVNMGKIRLNNAELIKALFLQKRNFGDEQTAQFRQIEIANEWDRMEYAFRNDDFWLFLNKEENELPARIEFLFNMICRVALKKKPEIREIIGDDEYTTFRYFNDLLSPGDGLEAVMNNWNNVKNYFLAFEEWYNNPIWYNYIGFLVYADESLETIYDWYKELDKEDFTNRLIAAISRKMNHISAEKKVPRHVDEQENELEAIIRAADEFLEADSNQVKTVKYDYDIDLEYSNKNRPTIRRLLLLYNIQCTVKQIKAAEKEKKGKVNIKFPFGRFKKEKWDVEHVDSYTSNPITTKQTQVEWLRTSAIDVGHKFDEELKMAIVDFIQNKTSKDDFPPLYNQIIQLAGENHINQDEKNGLGNLTLLDARTNRSYGNALYSSKRRIIIERDTEGRFIPVCTKNVFMKYFDKKGSSRTEWRSVDIVAYQNHIAETLSDFLNIKPV